MFRDLLNLIRSISGSLSAIANHLFVLQQGNKDLPNFVENKSVEYVERCDYHYIVEISVKDGHIKSDPLASLKIVNFFIASHIYNKKIIDLRIYKVYDDGRI